MQNIGITEWRGADATYPLSNGLFTGLFADASFLLFDYEAPLLTAVSVGVNTVTLIFNFVADLNTIFVYNRSDWVTNETLEVLYQNRRYGRLILGPSVENILTKLTGTTAAVNTKFHGNTVKIVNSKSGLYSFQGSYGAVDISTDSDLMLDLINPTSLSAVSLPNKLNVVQSDNTLLYLWNTTIQNLQVIGTVDQTYIIDPSKIPGNFITSSNVASLDLLSPVIYDLQAGMLGAAYNSDTAKTTIYDCSAYPWRRMCTLNYKIVQLTSISGHTYALTSTGLILDLNGLPAAYHTVITPSVANIKNIVAVDGGLIGCVSGVLDNSYLPTPAKYSDMYYKIATDGTCTALGTFRGPSNNIHMSGTKLMSKIIYNNAEHILVNSDNSLYVMPLNGGLVNPAQPIVYTASLPANTATYLYVVPGGWKLTYYPSVPLRSVNTAIQNTVHIIGDDIITISNTGHNELTVSMQIDDSLTNIQRTSHYE